MRRPSRAFVVGVVIQEPTDMPLPARRSQAKVAVGAEPAHYRRPPIKSGYQSLVSPSSRGLHVENYLPNGGVHLTADGRTRPS
jgi:hypothetical protein